MSGCVPVGGNGKVVSADIVEQARQVFANVGAVLAAGGSGFEHLVKVTVLLLDVDHREAVNALRQEVFGGTRPASTLFGVSRLPVPGARIEVETVAVVP
jgi:2-iminobutanoate/2-iminopropanoate deaminase